MPYAAGFFPDVHANSWASGLIFLRCSGGIFRPAIVGPGLPVEEFLTSSLVMEGDTSRFESLRAEAIRQLRAEAGISGVTVTATVPLEEPFADIEVEGGEASGVQARFNAVDDKFFEVSVRACSPAAVSIASDFGPGRTPVIVNRSFVTEILIGPPSQGSGGGWLSVP